jgi:hypothetical protein
MAALSDADNRVLALLRQRGRASVAAIGAACFVLAGKPERSGTRPAAAHLARMVERRLIRRQGNYYLLEAEASQPTLL